MAACAAFTHDFMGHSLSIESAGRRKVMQAGKIVELWTNLPATTWLLTKRRDPPRNRPAPGFHSDHPQKHCECVRSDPGRIRVASLNSQLALHEAVSRYQREAVQHQVLETPD